MAEVAAGDGKFTILVKILTDLGLVDPIKGRFHMLTFLDYLGQKLNLLNANLLVHHKKFGPVHNTLGPVEGPGICH